MAGKQRPAAALDEDALFEYEARAGDALYDLETLTDRLQQALSSTVHSRVQDLERRAENLRRDLVGAVHGRGSPTAPGAAEPAARRAWTRVQEARSSVLAIVARSALARVPPRVARLGLLSAAFVAALVFDHLSERIDVLAGSHLRAVFFLFFVQALILESHVGSTSTPTLWPRPFLHHPVGEKVHPFARPRRA